MPEYDFTGLRCPQPLLALQRMAKLNPSGTLFILKVDDPAAWGDIAAWCHVFQHHCKLLTPMNELHNHQPYQIEVQLSGNHHERVQK